MKSLKHMPPVRLSKRKKRPLSSFLPLLLLLLLLLLCIPHANPYTNPKFSIPLCMHPPLLHTDSPRTDCPPQTSFYPLPSGSLAASMLLSPFSDGNWERERERDWERNRDCDCDCDWYAAGRRPWLPNQLQSIHSSIHTHIYSLYVWRCLSSLKGSHNNTHHTHTQHECVFKMKYSRFTQKCIILLSDMGHYDFVAHIAKFNGILKTFLSSPVSPCR